MMPSAGFADYAASIAAITRPDVERHDAAATPTQPAPTRRLEFMSIRRIALARDTAYFISDTCCAIVDFDTRIIFGELHATAVAAAHRLRRYGASMPAASLRPHIVVVAAYASLSLSMPSGEARQIRYGDKTRLHDTMPLVP